MGVMVCDEAGVQGDLGAFCWGLSQHLSRPPPRCDFVAESRQETHDARLFVAGGTVTKMYFLIQFSRIF